MKLSEQLQFSGDPVKENPKAFLRTLDWYFLDRQITNDEQKCAFLQVSLQADSPADRWFESLDSATQTRDWTKLRAAFEAKWMRAAPSTMSDADALEYLQQQKLIKIGDILPYDTPPGQAARRRYRTWAGELELEVSRQRVDDRVAEQFRRALPKPLRNMLRKVTTWQDLFAQIQALDEDQLKSAVEDEERMLRLEQSASPKRLEASPSMGDSVARGKTADDALVDQLSRLSLQPQPLSLSASRSARPQYLPPLAQPIPPYPMHHSAQQVAQLNRAQAPAPALALTHQENPPGTICAK